MKFLIIRFSSIGDIVLTSPVIRCLKEQVPDATIHFLTKQTYRSLLAHNPYIDKVQVLDSSWDLMIHQLRHEGYDYIIDLHHNLRTLRIKRALPGVKHFSFDKLNLSKWLLTALKINRLPDRHIVDRYLATLKTFSVVNDGKGLDFFVSDKDQLGDSDLPMSHMFGYVGIVIGAALATKKLPVHKLQTLCKDIQFPIVLLGGPEDQKAGDEIAKVDDIKIYNSCGKFSLCESAELVKKAKLVIAHDTGLMHIAAAFKKPVISIWGNTIPEFGMYPYYGNDKVEQFISEVTGLRCRPCSKIGYSACPKGHFNCMERQDLVKVQAVVASII
jgi:heptosyltransferase-2